MFTLRSTQVRAFEQSTLAAFEEEMARHCRRFSPRLCKAAGDADLRRAIRRAITAAFAHGFTNRGPVRLYIDLALLFGGGFASDPQHPWAAEQLASAEVTEQADRAEALYEASCAYIERVGEPDHGRARAALEQIASAPSEGPSADPERLTADALRLMEQMHPEKYAYTGVEPLRALFASASSKAQTIHGLRGPRAILLMAALMFLFGHECDEDPLYAWIEQTLKGDDAPDRDRLALTLERRAAAWLDAVLKDEPSGGKDPW